MANADLPVLAITAAALEHLQGFLSGAAEADSRALVVRVSGVSGGQYVPGLALEVRRVLPGDAVQRAGDIDIVVPADSVDKLRGATVDWSDASVGGFVVVNPNRPPAPPMELPTLPMSGAPGPPPPPRAPAGSVDSELARRVIAVLERQVNPSIAAHGGRAELAGVDGATAYLRLGGGCQGCGMATVTLSQGIEVAIIEAVPEIERVVDVTDHASGTNPYYEAAKK